MAAVKPGDCLFNCLREVQLEKFHRNFVERGLINCDELGHLSMDQYSQFGVMSMDDRRRLFSIIQIIKSVQADGIVCQHGAGNRERKREQGISSVAMVHDAPGRGDAAHGAAGQGVAVPNAAGYGACQNGAMVRAATGRQEETARAAAILHGNLQHAVNPAFVPRKSVAEEGKERRRAAPGGGFIKPIHAMQNYRVTFERSADEDLKQKMSAKFGAALSKVSTDSPKFQCKKALNFSDPDLLSDKETADHGSQPALAPRYFASCRGTNSVVPSNGFLIDHEEGGAVSQAGNGVRPPPVGDTVFAKGLRKSAGDGRTVKLDSVTPSDGESAVSQLHILVHDKVSPGGDCSSSKLVSGGVPSAGDHIMTQNNNGHTNALSGSSNGNCGAVYNGSSATAFAATLAFNSRTNHIRPPKVNKDSAPGQRQILTNAKKKKVPTATLR